MMISFLYLAFVRVVQLIRILCRAQDDLAIEIVMLRHRDVFPETKEQRCWVHKSANILDALPKSIQPLAKKMLTEVREAEDREHARDAAKAFDNEFHAKRPKAAQKLRDDLEPLLCFYDFPAEHWLYLKTSNPIESTFATVRLRTKVTKGPGSRAAGLAMAFKLIEAAERPLALCQRCRISRSRARRCEVPKGGVGRDNCAPRGGRRVISGSVRSTTLDYSSPRGPRAVYVVHWRLRRV
jgi:hypothetical protein